MPTIAEKNDVIRKSFVGCRIVMTEGVRALLPELQSRVIEAVQKFSRFSADNDPYGQHDFGQVDVIGTEYFWKIDYFDKNFEFFEPDGHRVLTIMRADEY